MKKTQIIDFVSKNHYICRVLETKRARMDFLTFKATDGIVERMKRCSLSFGTICEGYQGDVNLSLKRDFFIDYMTKGSLPLVRGVHLSKYGYEPGGEFCLMTALSRNHVKNERIVFQEVANMGLAHRVKGTILSNVICGHSCNVLFSKDTRFDNRSILAVLNSKTVNYYFKYFNQTNHVPIGEIRKIPFPSIVKEEQEVLIGLVDRILNAKKNNPNADTSSLEQQIDHIVYHLYGLTYDEVLIVDPETPITKEEYEKGGKC